MNPWADKEKRASIMWGIRIAAEKRRKAKTTTKTIAPEGMCMIHTPEYRKMAIRLVKFTRLHSDKDAIAEISGAILAAVIGDRERHVGAAVQGREVAG